MKIILIGGMKCGSTSLRELLRSSGVFFGKGEEHYFDSTSKINKFLNYSNYLNVKYSKYDISLFGDDTPSYSYIENVPKIIKNDVPDAKIIFILRDPLNRAISNYWHAVRRGVEFRDINLAFQECLDNKSPNIWLDYLLRSKYVVQYERYLEHFLASDIFITSLEGLIDNFSYEKGRLSDFLNIDIVGDYLPNVNSRPFHGNPAINSLFNEKWNYNIVSKGVSLGIRYLFRYRINIPELSPVLQSSVKYELREEYNLWRGVRDV